MDQDDAKPSSTLEAGLHSTTSLLPRRFRRSSRQLGRADGVSGAVIQDDAHQQSSKICLGSLQCPYRIANIHCAILELFHS